MFLISVLIISLCGASSVSSYNTKGRLLQLQQQQQIRESLWHSFEPMQHQVDILPQVRSTDEEELTSVGSERETQETVTESEQSEGSQQIPKGPIYYQIYDEDEEVMPIEDDIYDMDWTKLNSTPEIQKNQKEEEIKNLQNLKKVKKVLKEMRETEDKEQDDKKPKKQTKKKPETCKNTNWKTNQSSLFNKDCKDAGNIRLTPDPSINMKTDHIIYVSGDDKHPHASPTAYKEPQPRTRDIANKTKTFNKNGKVPCSVNWNPTVTTKKEGFECRKSAPTMTGKGMLEAGGKSLFDTGYYVLEQWVEKPDPNRCHYKSAGEFVPDNWEGGSSYKSTHHASAGAEAGKVHAKAFAQANVASCGVKGNGINCDGVELFAQRADAKTCAAEASAKASPLGVKAEVNATVAEASAGIDGTPLQAKVAGPSAGANFAVEPLRGCFGGECVASLGSARLGPFELHAGAGIGFKMEGFIPKVTIGPISVGGKDSCCVQ